MVSEEKIMERVYETVLILRPDLPPQEGEGVVKKISQKIKDGGGEIFSCRLWLENRKFAYVLRSRGAERKKYDQGNYWLIEFKLAIEKLAELKEAIRLEENILRSLIIRKSD